MGSDRLVEDFEKQLRQRQLAPDNHIAYYVGWVQDFLRFCRDTGHAMSHEQTELFVNTLENKSVSPRPISRLYSRCCRLAGDMGMARVGSTFPTLDGAFSLYSGRIWSLSEVRASEAYGSNSTVLTYRTPRPRLATVG